MSRQELIDEIERLADIAYEKMATPYLDLKYYQGRYHAFKDVLDLLKGE